MGSDLHIGLEAILDDVKVCSMFKIDFVQIR